MNANVSDILKQLPNETFFEEGKSVKQTLLLFCLENQLMQNDIDWERKNVTGMTEDILEYKEIWLIYWSRKKNETFKKYLTLDIRNFDMNAIRMLYEDICQTLKTADPTWKMTVYNECARFEAYAFHELTVFDEECTAFKKWLKKEYSSIKLDDGIKNHTLKEIAKLLEITIQPM